MVSDDQALRHWLPAAALAACGLLSNCSLSAAERPPRGFADPLLGRWDLTIGGADGATYPSWLEVRLRTEWQLMARFVGRFGSTRYVDAISYDDGRLEFTAPVQYEAQAGALHFEAELADDRLAGTTADADGRLLNFTALRAPALQRDGPLEAGTPVEMFNGRDLDGWRSRQGAEPPGCWRVVRRLLVASPPCVDLVSEAGFRDFRLQVEFRYPPGSNSGLYLRGRYEVQIQDDAGMAPDPLRMGGVYGFLAPATNAAQPAGKWQTYDIRLAGRRVSVTLNGVTVIDDREIPGITGGALDSREGEPGPLMLQGDHGPISFRRIALTPLR